MHAHQHGQITQKILPGLSSDWTWISSGKDLEPKSQSCALSIAFQVFFNISFQ